MSESSLLFEEIVSVSWKSLFNTNYMYGKKHFLQAQEWLRLLLFSALEPCPGHLKCWK